MIDELATLVPRALRQRSGAVFYSGREAFGGHRPVYILGLNPGGEPASIRETVEEHTTKILQGMPCQWSAYSDEAWRAPPGESPLQRRVCHLLTALGMQPRHVPASNLIFSRTRSAKDLHGHLEGLADLCWPFHAAVLRRLGCRIIVCFGNDTAAAVRARLDAHDLVDCCTEENRRKLTSTAHRNADGLIVVRLTHPGRFNWCNPKSDPSTMVRRILEAM